MNRKSHYALIGATAFASGLVVNAMSAHGQISLTSGSYSQNFDSVLATQTPFPGNNSTQATPALPNGWTFFEASASGNTSYRIHNGGGNTGDTYLFGATGSAERALGGLAGTVTSTWGAQFVNGNAGLAITSLTLDYASEQWRDGGSGTSGTSSGPQWNEFQYSLNATSLTSGTWVDYDNLDGISSQYGNPPIALDGNTIRTVLGPTTFASGLTIAPGQTFWIRWVDPNNAGNDHGMGVDDLTLSFTTDTYTPPAQLTWDSDAGTAGIQDGNGTWSSGGNNWVTGGTQANWNSTTPDDATFGAGSNATAASVAIDNAGVTAGSVKFAAAGPVYTLNGAGTLNIKNGITAENDATIASAVNVGGSNSWTVLAGKKLTVSGAVAGSGAASEVALGGTGTTHLTNAGNSFAILQLDSGTLEVSTPAALGTAEMRLTGGTVKLLNDVNFNRLVRTSGAGGTIDTNGFNGEISGDLVGAGGLVKNGLGTLVLSNGSEAAPLNFSGATTINAGTIKLTGEVNNFSALGSGTVNVNNGATLHIDNIKVGIPGGGAGARVFLNDGSTLLGTGALASYNRLGDALTIANGSSGAPLTMDIKTLGSGDVFTLGSPTRQAIGLNGTTGGGATDTHATVRVSGPGRVILQGGYAGDSTSRNDAFAGSWELSDGILQIGPVAVGNTSGEPLNALGFKLGDTTNANAIKVNSGVLAVAADAPNPLDTTPPTTPPTASYLRNPVTLAGGSIASTGFQVDSTGNPTATPVSANFGGALTTVAATTSKILASDPVAGGARTVNIVADGNTTLNGALEIDPGTSPGGVVNFARTGGTATVGAGASLNVKAGTTLNMSGTNLLPGTSANGAALTVGGTFNLAAGSGYTVKASSINIPGGVLAMNDNDFIVDYDGASPEFQLRDYVKAFRDNAAATSGISFERGANDRVIAVAEKSEWSTTRTEFNGVAIDNTTIIGKHTYYGDANLDGKVDSNDYVAVDVGLGGGDSWVQGDFNFSGTVTSDDYVAIDTNLGKGVTIGDPLAIAELKAEMIALHTAQFGDAYVQALAIAEEFGYGALVPEPGTLSLVGIGAAGLLGRRRRRA